MLDIIRDHLKTVMSGLHLMLDTHNYIVLRMIIMQMKSHIYQAYLFQPIKTTYF